jgi:hypothetical protein
MSLFNNWLSKKVPESGPADAGASDWGKHTAPASQPSSDINASNRKIQRMERREALYGVVREVMIRSGVLSASYRFRVLSLDAGGRQYMIMMDVAKELAEQIQRLVEIEKLVMQTAKTRDDLDVTAVYWRINEQIAGTAQRPQDPAETEVGLPSPGKADKEEASHSASVEARAVQTSPSPLGEEVANFKRALASGVAAEHAKKSKAFKAAPARPQPAQRQDFAATQMLDPEALEGAHHDFAATQMLDESEMERLQIRKPRAPGKK